VGKFPNTVSGLIQWARHTVETWCDGLSLSVNPDKTGLAAFTRRRKLPGFFEPRLYGTTLHCSTSVKYLGGHPGFTAELKGTRGCQGEEGSKFVVGLQEGLWCGVGPGTQSGALALRLHHQASHHLRILGMVAWLSNGQHQEKIKQDPKIGMLRDNRSDAHYSHQYCGSTYLPPPN
jgi:hypothetical protein